eukprot:4384848-Pyramimonas_sp.AAC.1
MSAGEARWHRLATVAFGGVDSIESARGFTRSRSRCRCLACFRARGSCARPIERARGIRCKLRRSSPPAGRGARGRFSRVRRIVRASLSSARATCPPQRSGLQGHARSASVIFTARACCRTPQRALLPTKRAIGWST